MTFAKQMTTHEFTTLAVIVQHQCFDYEIQPFEFLIIVRAFNQVRQAFAESFQFHCAQWIKSEEYRVNCRQDLMNWTTMCSIWIHRFDPMKCRALKDQFTVRNCRHSHSHSTECNRRTDRSLQMTMTVASILQWQRRSHFHRSIISTSTHKQVRSRSALHHSKSSSDEMEIPSQSKHRTLPKQMKRKLIQMKILQVIAKFTIPKKLRRTLENLLTNRSICHSFLHRFAAGIIEFTRNARIIHLRITLRDKCAIAPFQSTVTIRQNLDSCWASFQRT